MLLEILNIATSGFWQFIAVIIIIALPFNFIVILWIKYMKMIAVTSQGYPPDHCDALGDVHNEEEDEDEV